MANSSRSALPPMGFIGVQIYFKRVSGDALNPRTWPFPLIREEVAGSTLADLVTDKEYPASFLDSFVAAAQRLVTVHGCVGIITDCGFLAATQLEVAERIDVPIATSALCQLPSIFAWLPRRKGVGVVTFDAPKLTARHFETVGVVDVKRVHVGGPPEDGELRKLVLEAREVHDHEAIEKEMIQCVRDLIQAHPDIGAILLECTQMAPFAEAIQVAVKLPVYDIYTMGTWFYSGLVNRRPEAWGPIDGSGPFA